MRLVVNTTPTFLQVLLQLQTLKLVMVQVQVQVSILQEDSDNGSHFIGLKSPDSVGSSVTYTLPFSQTGQTDKFFQRMVRELFLLYLLHQHLLVQQTQTFLLPVVDTFLSMTGQIRLIMLQYQVMQL